MSSWLSNENMIYAYLGITYAGGIYYYSSNEKFGNPKFTSKADPNYYKLMLQIGLAPITLPFYVVILPMMSDENQDYVARNLIGAEAVDTPVDKPIPGLPPVPGTLPPTEMPLDPTRGLPGWAQPPKPPTVYTDAFGRKFGSG